MSKKADFQARIKRIEITNKVLKGGWRQAIRVVLDDIALTNENLLELRQFKPNENVDVIIRPVPEIEAVNISGEDIPLVEICEGGVASSLGKVEKAWEF
ncbi:MAG: hypothetical protein VR69_01505 [Peptococcaceae bacterium BRH_c4b]|nr:MAG: hypothetical protein VR69_01505 [Peptococcaceae bacterium BRH_c4b]